MTAATPSMPSSGRVTCCHTGRKRAYASCETGSTLPRIAASDRMRSRRSTSASHVEQQHVGIGDQRPGDRHALAHPARQVRRPGVLEAGQADEVDQAGHAAAARRSAGDLQRQADVALDAAPREQGGVLEGDPEPSRSPQRDGRQPVHEGRPGVGVSRSARMRSTVDLPHPDGPSRATNSPRPALSSRRRRPPRSVRRPSGTPCAARATDAVACAPVRRAATGSAGALLTRRARCRGARAARCATAAHGRRARARRWRRP